jgi:hypothetical protein
VRIALIYFSCQEKFATRKLPDNGKAKFEKREEKTSDEIGFIARFSLFI